jgi:hypothetical protein
MSEDGKSSDSIGDTATPKIIVIRSADDAWRHFESALNSEDTDTQPVQLVFDGWPNYQMVVKGRDWDSTVPTRVMSPLLDLQQDINRLFASIYYGAPNLRKLNDDDRDMLELIVKVNKGSSSYDAPLDKQLTELSKRVIEKMESRHLMITILGAALVWGGVEINKSWVASRQAEKQVEQTVEISKQETERLKIFAKAVESRPVLASVQTDYQETQNRVLKTLKPADAIDSRGVHLSGGQAAEIAQPQRATSSDIDLQEDFYVLANDASRPTGFRIKVRRVANGTEFLADVPIELSQDEKVLIQAAEWSKGGRRVGLSITATLLRGKIIQAKVYGAKASEKPLQE